MTKKPLITCFAVALVGFVISEIMLRNGVESSPDGWAYWEGSVNLIENHRYTYMSGNHIWAWPPLFSMFLSFFQLFLPQTGKTLILVMSVVSGLSTYVWSLYTLKLFPDVEKPGNLAACIGSLLFVVLFIPLCCLSLLSNSLLLFFVGILFNRLVRLREEVKFWTFYKGPVLLGLCLSGCMLTHNSSLVFVAMTVVAVGLAGGGGGIGQRALGSRLIMLISLVPWLLIRLLLHQEGSHAWTKGIYSPIQYVGQVLSGVGTFFISSSSVPVQGAVGALILASVAIPALQRTRVDTGVRCQLCLRLALVVLAGLFIIFNFVPIGSKLDGRFLYYFPVAVAPVLWIQAKRYRPVFVLLILMTVGVSGWRVCKNVWRGAVPALNEATTDQPATIIHSEYLLTSRATSVVSPGEVRIKTPVYPWEKMENMNVPVKKEPVVRLLDGTGPASGRT
jgi:hypothetical protein